jgi:hypothetical protein
MGKRSSKSGPMWADVKDKLDRMDDILSEYLPPDSDADPEFSPSQP